MLHAVAVGIDRYLDPRIRALSCASRDASAFAALLERIDPSERKITLLLNEQATRESITWSIAEELSRNVQLDDVVLLYFAGHGCPERGSPRQRISSFLVPYDADHKRVYTTCIDMEHELPRMLERLDRARLVVLFLDACFSGAAGGRTFRGPIFAANPGLDTLGAENRPISIRSLDLGRGRVIVCASDETQVAREDKALGHGIFTYHLLQALARPRPGGVLRITDLYNELQQAVFVSTNRAQEPVISMVRNRGASLPALGQ